MTGIQTSECPNCGARNRVPAAQTGGEVHRTQVGALAPGPLVEWVGGALERS